MILYETSKEFLKAESKEELFEVILFSIMGQVGVSSSSIMMSDPSYDKRWEIVESQGVDIDKGALTFSSAEGILGELVSQKRIIDIETFRDNNAFRDDYYKYISIDSRMLIPMIYNNKVTAAIVLGNKLDNEDYSAEEIDFLNGVAEFSSYIYHTIMFKEKNISDIKSLEKDVGYIRDIDILQKKMISDASTERMRDVIQEEFHVLGIQSFSFFIRNPGSGDFQAIITDSEGSLGLNQFDFHISRTSGFIEQIDKAESPAVFEDFRNLKTVVEIFTDRQVKAMSILRAYPFRIGGELIGFVMLFGVSESVQMEEVDSKMKKIIDFLFPYVSIIRNLEYKRGAYQDNITGTYNRIDQEVQNAHNLKIPLTVILFSIKNYKRFYSSYGSAKTRELLYAFEKSITSRLADRDFSVRFDRNKILIILPGKDKKFAVPLANSVKNDLTHSFSTRDVQLLVTFLTAEYPNDGRDVYALIDAVD